jgi:hypothetical protein
MLFNCIFMFKQNVAQTLASFVFTSLILLTLMTTSQAQPVTMVNDGHGKEWRLPQLSPLSWNQAATVCPQDGINQCSGSVGSVNVNGWTWATDEQVQQLMSYYEPAMATNRSVAGFDYFNTATAFMTAFQAPITFQGCGGYFCTGTSSQFLNGWTSAKDSNGLPYLGSSSATTFGGGSFAISPNSNVNSAFGLWLWRDPNGIYANDDNGMVASPLGGTALSNVLANDTIASVQATFANVFITQVSTSNLGVSLNAGTGSVSVAGGTPAGTHTLVYRMCSNTNVDFCDNGTVSVLVKQYVVDAVNDYGNSSPSTTRTVLNVLSNDTFTGGPVAGNVGISLVTPAPSNSGITLDTTTGNVIATRGYDVGIFSLTYRICANIEPSVCDTATVTVDMKHYIIDAVNDYVRASSKIGSSPINVLTNDKFNGGPATPAQVQITQLSAPIYGITLNNSTGLVTVATKTASSGTYNITYKICEINMPTNCDTAVATIELSGR